MDVANLVKQSLRGQLEKRDYVPRSTKSGLLVTLSQCVSELRLELDPLHALNAVVVFVCI